VLRFWRPQRLFKDNDRVRYRNHETTISFRHSRRTTLSRRMGFGDSTHLLRRPQALQTAVDPFADRTNPLKPNVLPGHIMTETHTERQPDA
jgi:hypothetical protein